MIADTGEFTKRNLDKAKYAVNPLEDGSLAKWHVLAFDISALTIEAVKPFGLGNKDALRCKNMWTLGLALWMFDRDRAADPSTGCNAKFKSKPELAEANIAALNAGHAYGETAELSGPLQQAAHRAGAERAPGLYRTITGAEAVSARPRRGRAAGRACRCSSAAIRSPRPPRSCTTSRGSRNSASPPSRRRTRSPRSAPRSARAMPGSSASPRRRGPGIALKGEAMGLAIMTELPLVIVNSQRGGPSTGLPTKTEQSDLYQAVYGRNGDAPMPVIAARSPGRRVRMRDRGVPHRDRST